MSNLHNIDLKRVEENFSGAVLINKGKHVIHQSVYGYANRSEEVKNEINTRFGIASGCKIFTAVAICQLVEKGLLSFDTKIKNCMSIPFPNFDDNVTLHHLLTHTSGIPDYFDEAIMEDFADLWKERPMYTIQNLKDFLPMFQNHSMMFSPGEKFHYNNAGYIVLGLIVEEKSGLPFTKYVEKNIFEPCGMKDSGYFSLDQLPVRTALGYIEHEDGTWHTNIYSIPIKGGSDGGAFVTVGDMAKFWDSLIQRQLLSREITTKLLSAHASEEDGDSYGYGVWISRTDGKVEKYHVMGYDPGVSFHSCYYPNKEITVTSASNKSYGAYAVIELIENYAESLL